MDEKERKRQEWLAQIERQDGLKAALEGAQRLSQQQGGSPVDLCIDHWLSDSPTQLSDEMEALLLPPLPSLQRNSDPSTGNSSEP